MLMSEWIIDSRINNLCDGLPCFASASLGKRCRIIEHDEGKKNHVLVRSTGLIILQSDAIYPVRCKIVMNILVQESPIHSAIVGCVHNASNVGLTRSAILQVRVIYVHGYVMKWAFKC
jgi:hypothetical protein